MFSIFFDIMHCSIGIRQRRPVKPELGYPTHEKGELSSQVLPLGDSKVFTQSLWCHYPSKAYIIKLLRIQMYSRCCSCRGSNTAVLLMVYAFSRPPRTNLVCSNMISFVPPDILRGFYMFFVFVILDGLPSILPIFISMASR